MSNPPNDDRWVERPSSSFYRSEYSAEDSANIARSVSPRQTLYHQTFHRDAQSVESKWPSHRPVSAGQTQSNPALALGGYGNVFTRPPIDVFPENHHPYGRGHPQRHSPSSRRAVLLDIASLQVQTGIPDKPRNSYAQLITYAIATSESKQMTLSDLYQWCMDNFPYFRNSQHQGWKNSLRHNLSLNKTFMKVPRPVNESGKGSYWILNPEALQHGLMSTSQSRARQRSKSANASTREQIRARDAAVNAANEGASRRASSLLEAPQVDRHQERVSGGCPRNPQSRMPFRPLFTQDQLQFPMFRDQMYLPPPPGQFHQPSSYPSVIRPVIHSPPRQNRFSFDTESQHPEMWSIRSEQMPPPPQWPIQPIQDQPLWSLDELQVGNETGNPSRGAGDEHSK